MKSLISKIIAIIMVMSVILSIAACGSTTQIDKRKTQLYIGNFNGATGDEWLKAFARQFEALYAEEEFEVGRKGVQIIIDNNKAQYEGSLLVSTIATVRQDIFFTNNVDHPELIARGLVSNITDIVTEKFDRVDLGEGIKDYSIEDKMSDEVKEFFSHNGEYYFLPFLTPSDGIVYDVDLFCEKKLYFLSDGVTINGSIDSNTPEQLLNGNGLPDTWPRFMKLLDTMVARDVIPFTWTGMYTYTREQFCNYIWANYEGYNDYMLNMSLNGTMSDGTEIVNGKNGWKLVENKGRLAYAKAAYDILSKSDYYSNDAFKTTQTHTMAQEEYLMSRLVADEKKGKQIAMLLESSYWDNESLGVFADMEEIDEKYAQSNRRFGMLPAPQFKGVNGIDDQTNTEQVIVSSINSACFINASSKKQDLAKLFLQFCHSNDALSKFNSITGVTRNFNYVMSDEDYNAMSHYQKSCYDLFEQANRKIAFYSYSPTFRTQSNYFRYWNTRTVIDNNVHGCVFDAFYRDNSLTPLDWYSSMTDRYNESTWPAALN